MSRYIDADALEYDTEWSEYHDGFTAYSQMAIDTAPSIDIVICEECRKSHVDGKTTHHLWCTEWGRSTDVFGYCERGEREGE